MICQICGGEFDVDSGPRSSRAPSVDHIVPLSHMRGLDAATIRRLSLDPGNLRAVHFGCNSIRGNRTKRQGRSTEVLRRW